MAKETGRTIQECITCRMPIVTKAERCPRCGFKVKDRIDIIKTIQVHAVTDNDPKKPGEKGWVHTHGMHELGFAELEIRNVPLFLVPSAVRFINGLADYMVNGPNPITVGQTYAAGGFGVCRLVKAEPIVNDQDVIESHYKTERWLISDETMVHLCDGCKTGGKHDPKTHGVH